MDIKIEQLEHRYMPNTPFERVALRDINLTINDGDFVAIIGHTGSGKSTLVQHLNALLKPTSGKIHIGDKTIVAGQKDKVLKPLRKKVGIVFQYPEHQLFEETVEKDICFGPMNFGMSLERAQEKAKEALAMTGLSESLLEKSPFDLSGGQMRRVAIAGVLAMEPEVLILDEPTAGLDPRGRVEIMEMFAKLHRDRKMTTILVTHSMEDAAKYADQIIVMEKGAVYKQGTPADIFSNPEELIGLGLDVPESVQFLVKLEKAFGIKLPYSVFELDDIAEMVVNLLKGRDRV